MKKYLTYYVLNLKNSLEYRGELVAWVVFEILSLSSALFMWFAVYRDHSIVGGFSFHQMIQYYFLMPIVGAIASAHIILYLPKDIKNGDLSKELIKPYSIAWTRILNQAAIKLIQNTIKLPIYLFVGFWLTKVIGLTFNPMHILVGAVVAVGVYLLHCLFDLTISTFSFWMEDTWALGLIKQIGLMIFGGVAYPISLVPENWRLIYNILPFDLFFYLPTSLMMGTLTAADIQWYAAKVAIWTAILLISRQYLWKKGLQSYCAYGQ